MKRSSSRGSKNHRLGDFVTNVPSQGKALLDDSDESRNSAQEIMSFLQNIRDDDVHYTERMKEREKWGSPSNMIKLLPLASTPSVPVFKSAEKGIAGSRILGPQSPSP